jgi:hypothetical protein
MFIRSQKLRGWWVGICFGMESSVQEFNSGGAFLFCAAGISTALQGCFRGLKNPSI